MRRWIRGLGAAALFAELGTFVQSLHLFRGLEWASLTGSALSQSFGPFEAPRIADLTIGHVLLHFSASLVLAICFSAEVRGQTPARRRRLQVALFAFSLVFFMPVGGALGLACIVWPALLWPKRKEVEPWQTIGIPDLPHRPLFVDVTSQPKYSEGGLVVVLQHAKDADQRLGAVMALRQMEDSLAVPLLRVALKDPVDDVRLLAYSMLDSKDHAINKRIQKRLTLLAQGSGPIAPIRPSAVDKAAQFFIHRSIARDYFELAFLGIASGDVLQFVLRSARKHIEKALLIREERSACFLLGRIALRMKDTETAKDAFDRAEALGFARETLAPERAEIAFLERRWSDVRMWLSSVDRHFLVQPPLDEVAAFWLEDEALG